MNKNSFISKKAKISRNVYIGNNVRIFSNTIIGQNCFIDDNVTIGHPSKTQLSELISKGNIPPNLTGLDKYSDRETVILDSCCIRFGSFVSSGVSIGENSYLDFNTQIGAMCKIGNDSQLLYGARLYYQVKVGNKCRVSGFCCNNSIIEDNSSMFGQLIHAYRIPKGGIDEPSPIIRNGATVGWHAIVIGNTIIGKNSYVAAGATVTKNVPDNYIVTGSANDMVPLNQWHGNLNKLTL